MGTGRLCQPSGIGTPEDPIEERLPAEFGWFPFPAVEGGAGAATDGFGGGDGLLSARMHHQRQFSSWNTSLPSSRRFGPAPPGRLPVTTGAEVSVTDPLQQEVLAGLGQAASSSSI